jgi:hypothetical protein
MSRYIWIALCLIAPSGIAQEPPTSAALEESGLRELRNVRRVYVDRLTGGETAAQMRDILINSLETARIFVLTENQERADAILRGAAEDLVFTETHSSSDSLNAHANFGTSRSSSTSRGQYGGFGMGQSEDERSAERRHEAIAAVRLVNKDGDVIWATTQESLGAKFRGSSADVADKIAAQLKEDFEKARKLR